MQSAYSWMGSRLHLVLEDEVAANYNRAQDAFLEAQKNHEKIHGQKWNPVNEPLLIDWTKEEAKAWDDLADLINRLIEINDGGLDIQEEECTSTYFVKV